MNRQNLIFKNFDYVDEADVLVRVYASQDKNPPENELFCGEVLFRPYLKKNHIRVTAPYPRGIATALISEIKKLDKNLKVQISNELEYHVFHLSSCNEIFDEVFHREINLLKKG